MKNILMLCLLTVSLFNGRLYAKTLVPIEVYGSVPGISQMAMSPSGNRIAYRLSEKEKDMVVVYSVEHKKLVAGVDVKDIRPSSVYFINDDTLALVAVENTRMAGVRGRHDFSAAFSYQISTKKLKQLLVHGDGVYKAQTALGRIVGSSTDGDYVYMPAWESKGQYSLMKVKLAGKRKPRSVKRGVYDAIDYFIYEDRIVARERFDNKQNLHRLEALIDDEWKEIFREETEIPTRSFVGLTADLKNIVMLAYGSNGRGAYYTMSLNDGKVSGPIFNPEDKDVDYVISDINRIVHGVLYSGFRPSYDFFDKRVDDIVKKAVNELPDYSLYLRDYTSDWKNLLFYIEGHDSPGDYYLHKDGDLHFIASAYKDIPGDKVYQVFETKVKARDGLYLPTLLTLPNVEELKNLPAIMLPHGGPESYDANGFDYMAQFFASRGYLVMQPQFRGSDGFGLDFKLKGRGEWGRKMQDDLTDTVRTLVKSGYVDPDRVCIVGASYGGYAALAGATLTPDVYKCAVSINGVSDIERMFRDEKRDYGSDHWVVAYWNRVIASGKVSEDHLADISPINHADKVKIPVLLIHGTHDEIVPYRQSENMYEALQDADKDVKYVEVEKGDHSFVKTRWRLQSLKAIDDFLSKHL